MPLPISIPVPVPYPIPSLSRLLLSLPIFSHPVLSPLTISLSTPCYYPRFLLFSVLLFPPTCATRSDQADLRSRVRVPPYSNTNTKAKNEMGGGGDENILH